MRGFFITLSLSFSVLSLPAYAACENGMAETLVSPAKIEEGFVKASSIRYVLDAETRIHPAKYEIMTQAEYEALDEDMTYTTYEWKYAKYTKEPIEPATNIAKYDIILTPDGNQFHRPIEEKINDIPLVLHTLVLSLIHI